MDRRSFLKTLGVGGAGLALSRGINPLKSYGSPFVDVNASNTVGRAPYVGINGALVEILENGNIAASGYTNGNGDCTLDLGWSSVGPNFQIKNEEAYGKIKIFNNNGGLVDIFNGHPFDVRKYLTSRSQHLANGFYIAILENSNGIYRGKFTLVDGSVMGAGLQKDNLINKLDNSNNLQGKNSGRRTSEDLPYTLRITHENYETHEEPIDISGNMSYNASLMPLDFPWDLLAETCLGGNAPLYNPQNPLKRWMYDPQVYIHPDYPAPNSTFQDILEDVLTNSNSGIPYGTDGVRNPEIVTNEPNEHKLLVAFVPNIYLPPNALGSHSEWFENPLNNAEITRGYVQILNSLQGENLIRTVMMHEFNQNLLAALDTTQSQYGDSIFYYQVTPQSSGIYSQEDLDVVKYTHLFPAGTIFNT